MRQSQMWIAGGGSSVGQAVTRYDNVLDELPDTPVRTDPFLAPMAYSIEFAGRPPSARARASTRLERKLDRASAAGSRNPTKGFYQGIESELHVRCGKLAGQPRLPL